MVLNPESFNTPFYNTDFHGYHNGQVWHEINTKRMGLGLESLLMVPAVP